MRQEVAALANKQSQSLIQIYSNGFKCLTMSHA